MTTHAKTMIWFAARLVQLTTISVIIVILISGSIADARFCGFPFQFLSRWFTPVHYDIDLKPDLVNHSHSGQVQILINTLKSPDLQRKRHLILHAGHNLQISNVKLYRLDIFVEHNSMKKNLHSFPEIKIKEICHDDKYDILLIEMEEIHEHDNEYQMLQESKQIVAVIQFTGQSHFNGQGLVRINYGDLRALKESRRLLYTKFDRFKAQFVYPCFNEPRMKATIKLTLTGVSERELGFSTMHVMPNRGRARFEFSGSHKVKHIEFQKTKPMSMHNFGFVVGTLKYDKLAMLSPEPDLNLYFMQLRGEYIQHGEITMAMLRNVLQHVSSYDGVNFPLKYVNVIVHPGIGRALESNFAGTIVVDGDRILRAHMNNWGEQAMVIANMVELLMRQWYGYMITQELDHETWFFDGLIGWHTMKITNLLLTDPASLITPFPSTTMNYSMIFASRFISNAMIEDSSSRARPLLIKGDDEIEVPESVATDLFFANEQVYDNDEHNTTKSIDQLSDRMSKISFQQQTITMKRVEVTLSETQKVKAIGIISNYEIVCGDKWPEVLGRYVRKYSFKISKSYDLMWYVKRDCNSLMHDSENMFLESEGLPLIKVKHSDGNNLFVSQEPFSADYTQSVIVAPVSNHNERRWILPVGYTYGNYHSNWHHQSNFIITNADSDTLVSLGNVLDLNRPGTWVKLNDDGKGYYRVLYGDRMLNSMLNAVKNNTLSDLDCFNLLDDAMAIVKSGKVGSYYLVHVLKAVAQRSNEIIQARAIEAFRELKRLYIQYAEIHNLLCDLGIELFANTFMTHGMTMSNILSDEGVSARIQIYEQLATLDLQSMILSSLNLYKSQYLASLDPRLHTSVFIVVARHGSDEDFTTLLSYLLSPTISSTPDLADKIVIGLANATQQSRLEFVWLKMQDLSGRYLARFVRTLLNSPEGQLFAIETVLEQLPSLCEKMNHDEYKSLVIELCNNLANKTIFCSPNSPIGAILGQNNWYDLINSTREMRRRTFYLQRLDHNKLVFD